MTTMPSAAEGTIRKKEWVEPALEVLSVKFTEADHFWEFVWDGDFYKRQLVMSS
ncbi:MULTISPECIES: hypothetical protein [Cohnella]|uniref:hypothetical protein n=1 Tax=Cohnella TaxID=329857 RepID=UPI001593904E|nr:MULTISPECIES: hypothetical protein [Cohnella]MBN2982581.1 hypothetical protein [Cohnella algarum]